MLPTWHGNEFLLPDGRRATIRTLTPRRFDRTALELDLDIVLHGGGVAGGWATSAGPGDEAAISGPGRRLRHRSRGARLRARRRRDRDPGHQPAARAPACGGAGARVRRGRRSRRRGSRCRVTPEPPSAGSTRRPAPVPATRWWRRSATPTSGPAGASGPPVRRRRCSGSAVTCSTSGVCLARRRSCRGYWKHGRAGGDAAT